LAVVVLKENAGEGATVAAPIARQILAGALPLYP
jgi:cell division protein FtsI/penicillin-binding protein 2